MSMNHLSAISHLSFLCSSHSRCYSILVSCVWLMFVSNSAVLFPSLLIRWLNHIKCKDRTSEALFFLSEATCSNHISLGQKPIWFEMLWFDYLQLAWWKGKRLSTLCTLKQWKSNILFLWSWTVTVPQSWRMYLSTYCMQVVVFNKDSFLAVWLIRQQWLKRDFNPLGLSSSASCSLSSECSSTNCKIEARCE